MGRARRHWVGVLAACAAITAGCNALSGASDLTFGLDEDAAMADASAVDSALDDAAQPADSRAAGDVVEAEADVPCDAMSPITTVTGTPNAVANDPGVGSVAWVVSAFGNQPSGAVMLQDDEISHWLVATSFGLKAQKIPANAIIDGFVVTITRQARSSASDIADQGIALVKAGTPLAPKANAGTWSLAATTVTYGAAADTWGSTWTVDDVIDAKFGVAVAARAVAVTGTETAAVNAIKVAVSFHTCGP